MQIPRRSEQEKEKEEEEEEKKIPVPGSDAIGSGSSRVCLRLQPTGMYSTYGTELLRQGPSRLDLKRARNTRYGAGTCVGICRLRGWFRCLRTRALRAVLCEMAVTVG